MGLDFEAHRVTVHFDPAPELRPIIGHRGQLLEVLLNGLKNAVESLADVSDRKREVRLSTVPLDPHVVAISIEDSGAGLDARDRRRAFEPFYTTKPRGMGLGLSICQSIVSVHEGALSLVPLTARRGVAHRAARVARDSYLAGQGLEPSNGDVTCRRSRCRLGGPRPLMTHRPRGCSEFVPRFGGMLSGMLFIDRGNLRQNRNRIPGDRAEPIAAQPRPSRRRCRRRTVA